jgi:hypothetical protein
MADLILLLAAATLSVLMLWARFALIDTISYGVVLLFVLPFLAALFSPVIVFLSREVVASRKATRYWREKWRDEITNEKNAITLLRPTLQPAAPSDTLLRATAMVEETKAEELLRSSN